MQNVGRFFLYCIVAQWDDRCINDGGVSAAGSSAVLYARDDPGVFALWKSVKYWL